MRRSEKYCIHALEIIDQSGDLGGAAVDSDQFLAMNQNLKAKATANKVQPAASKVGAGSTLSVSGTNTKFGAPKKPAASPIRNTTPKVSGAVNAAKSESVPDKPGEKTESKTLLDKQYRNLIDPKVQEQRKAQHLEAFEKLKSLSMEDLQIEFIVCIRAGNLKLPMVSLFAFTNLGFSSKIKSLEVLIVLQSITRTH